MNQTVEKERLRRRKQNQRRARTKRFFMVLGVLVVLVVPNVLNLAVYGWGRDAAYLRSYAGKLAAKLKRKGKAE